MIVRLVRPETDLGPWLIYAPGGIVGFIDPSPELSRTMEGASGYVHAEPTDTGWDIGEPAPDQPW